MSERLRYILNDPSRNKVCLDDIVKVLANTSEKLRHLEYKNSAHSLREAKKAFRVAKNLIVDFEVRLKGEITEEIVKAISKVDKRVDPNNEEQIKAFFGE